MKRTKTKLISSITVLIVCFAMLIGSTFAWFTDSASTGVNKIQAGNLDVQLLNGDGTSSIEGESLKWIKAAGQESEQVLWEPGATFKLESFKIKNNGNLKLKYKINISGITGDALLLNALDFIVNGVSSSSSLSDLNGFEGALEPNTTTPAITIKATMKPDAGNEYQGLSIENIGITVQATQLGGEFGGINGENDSFNNTYDENATYPPLASYLNNTVKQAVMLDEVGKTGGSETIISDDNATSIIPAQTVIYGANANEPVATNDAGTLNRNIKTTASTSESVTYNISYNYVDANGTSTPVVKFGNVVENVIDVSSGLEVVKVTHTHDDVTTEMNPADSKNAKEDGKYYYDSLDGKIYLWSSKYSEFKVDYKSDYTAATGGQGYATLQEAVDAVKDNGTVILLKDVALTGDLPIGTGNKNINLNLNTKTIDGRSYQVYTAGDGTIKIFGDGTIKNNNTEKNTNCAALYIVNGSNVALNGVTLEGYYGVYAYGNLAINEATINAIDCGIAVNGSANVNVGTEAEHNISVNASDGNCISTQVAESNSNMVVNVYGGNFISNTAVNDNNAYLDCPIYWASHGTLNVYGGTFKNITEFAQAAGILQKNGTVNISDGIFEAKDGIKIVAQGDSTEITTSIVGGNFTGTRSGIYIDASNSNNMGRLTEYNVAIDNGDKTPTFIGGSEGAIYAKTGGLGDKKLMLISGGEFNDDPSEYVAEGKMAIPSDGMYQVVDDTRVKNEEQLKAAVEKGGEFTLGANIQLTESLKISKNATMNLDSFTITGKEKTSAISLIADTTPVKVTVNATTGGVSASGSNGDCFEMPWYNEHSAELTINGGTYTSDNGYFVDINSGSSSPETRKDKVYINEFTYAGASIINATTANTEIVMTSGNLTGTNKGIVLGNNSTNTKFTMTGGSIICESGLVITAQAQGNTIDISEEAEVTGKLSLKNSTMNIRGGTVNITGLNGDNRAIMLNEGSELNISDTGKVNGNPLFHMNGGSVNITGGSFKGKIVNGLNYGNDYLKSVKDLLIDDYYLSEADSDGWYHVSSEA